MRTRILGWRSLAVAGLILVASAAAKGVLQGSAATTALQGSAVTSASQ